MKSIREFLALMVVAGLGYQANAGPVTKIPTVNINDTTGPITVSWSGFSSFSSGSIGNSSEGVWWCGTGNNLGMGSTFGIWTEPGSSKISDEFIVAVYGNTAYGIFLSDPSVAPTTITIPVAGAPGGSITIDLTKFKFTSSSEPSVATDISPTTSLSVMATSGVPDGGSTIILLGLGMGGLVWFGKRRGRHTD